MRPRLVPTLALASAACCVLLCGLWVASYRWAPVVQRLGGTTEWGAGLERGTVSVSWWDAARTRPLLEQWWRADIYEVAADNAASRTGEWSGLGFGLIPSTWRGSAWCPLWFPILLTGAWPAWWWMRRKKRAGARGFVVATAATPGQE